MCMLYFKYIFNIFSFLLCLHIWKSFLAGNNMPSFLTTHEALIGSVAFPVSELGHYIHHWSPEEDEKNIEEVFGADRHRTNDKQWETILLTTEKNICRMRTTFYSFNATSLSKMLLFLRMLFCSANAVILHPAICFHC